MGLDVAFFLMAASFLITMAMMPKAQQPKAAAFEDFDFPQAEEGTPQAVFFGDCWTSDWTVLAVGNYRAEAIKKSS